LGLGVFVALRVYQVRSETWAGFVFGMAWLALLGVLLFWFARQRSWEPRHQLAAALGTYAWLGFVLTSLGGPWRPDPLVRQRLCAAPVLAETGRQQHQNHRDTRGLRPVTDKGRLLNIDRQIS
jgi:hypothetical protein